MYHAVIQLFQLFSFIYTLNLWLTSNSD